MKTEEQVFTSQILPADSWRDPDSQEDVWEAMRRHTAEYAAADSKTLTGTPGTRHVLWQRPAAVPEGGWKLTECTEAEAKFVKLTLTCWASKD